jgi:hypothetical protein
MGWREWLTPRREAVRREEKLARELESVRFLLRSASKQRDHAHLLLRCIREYDSSLNLPGWLLRDIRCAVALESESDIDDARQQAARHIASHGTDPVTSARSCAHPEQNVYDWKVDGL